MPESTACDRKRKQAIHSGFAVFDKPAVRIRVDPKGGECHDDLRAALRRTRLRQMHTCRRRAEGLKGAAAPYRPLSLPVHCCHNTEPVPESPCRSGPDLPPGRTSPSRHPVCGDRECTGSGSAASSVSSRLPPSGSHSYGNQTRSTQTSRRLRPAILSGRSPIMVPAGYTRRRS